VIRANRVTPSNAHAKNGLMAATADRAYVGAEGVTAVMPKPALYTVMQPFYGEMPSNGGKGVTASGPDGGLARTRT